MPVLEIALKNGVVGTVSNSNPASGENDFMVANNMRSLTPPFDRDYTGGMGLGSINERAQKYHSVEKHPRSHRGSRQGHSKSRSPSKKDQIVPIVEEFNQGSITERSGSGAFFNIPKIYN